MSKKMEMKELIEDTTLSFSRYTITDRATPKVSDGLKAIHRRIIFSMYLDKLRYNKFRAKSSTVSGSVLRFSPHGDSSAYDSMVRLANDSVTYRLIDGKGAFGTVTSSEDNGGAPRYTESRLGLVAEELLQGLNSNAVDFVPNYDETRLEPSDLPASFPMILANPNKGIAVSIATNIPSFDLKDIRDNVEALLFKGEQKLMYPTFVTGGYVLRDDEVAKQVQKTGRGSFKMRARYEVNDNNIIITEIPYGSKVEAIIDRIIALRNEKDSEFTAITNINDDTDVRGLRIRIETKKGTDKDNLMKMLYAKTPLQANFPCNMYVLDNSNIPRLWGTEQILLEWIKFRAETLKRIATFDIAKNKKELNILYGLQSAMGELDEIISLIRSSNDEDVIESVVTMGYNLEQAEYIVGRSIRQLNKTYIANKIKTIKELEKEVKRLESFVKSKKKIADRILSDIDKAIEKNYVERKTEIVDEFDTAINRTVVEEANDYNVRVIVTNDGYVKKIPLTSLRGNATIQYKEGDFAITDIETVNSEELLVFTDKHNVYKKRFLDLTDTKPSELGTYLINEVDLESDEKILGIVPLSEHVHSILIGFEDGKIAKIDTESYRTKQNRSVLKSAFANKIAILFVGLTEDIDLMSISTDTKTVLMSTEKINSKSSKTSQGVTFQKLKDDNTVKEYLLNFDNIKNLEYYRIASAGVGKYFKEE